MTSDQDRRQAIDVMRQVLINGGMDPEDAAKAAAELVRQAEAGNTPGN